MTKSEIIRDIVRQTGVDAKEVRVIVDTLLSTIKRNVCQEEGVYFRRFGTFGTKTRAKKIGRNISKNTSIVVEAHKIPYFKPSKEFSQDVRTSLPIQ